MASKTVSITASTAGLLTILAMLTLIPGVKITGSPDIHCAGTPTDLCCGYFNITSTNYTIYLKNRLALNITWGGGTQPKSWWLMKKSGTKWPQYNLSKNHTLSRNVTHQFQVCALKNDPQDTLKWGVLAGNANLDPLFLPPADVTLTTRKNTSIEFFNESVRVLVKNDKCVFHPENVTHKESWESCMEFNQFETVLRNRTVVVEWQELAYDGKIVNTLNIGVWCYDTGTQFICKSIYDGDGAHHIPAIKPGESYFAISKTFTGTVSATGHLGAKYDTEVVKALK